MEHYILTLILNCISFNYSTAFTELKTTHPAILCSKLSTETLEQGVKNVQS